MSDDVDAARFPTVARYLARLPGGYDAYPDCKIKGSLVRAMLEGHRVEARGALPAPLVELLRDPPAATDWLSQVAGRCVLRAVFDAHYGDLERFRRWTYESQRRLFSGRLYKILFWGVGPDRLVRLAAARYAHFHQGVSMRLEPRPGGGTAIIEHPALLFDEVDHPGTMEGIRAALEIAGAEGIVARVTAAKPRETRMEFAWRT